MSKKKAKKDSSSVVIYVVLFLLLVLASISWVQNNTRPQNYAQDVTPLLRCESPCTYNSQCPTGLFCHNGSCRNPQCKDASDCTCVITPTIDVNRPTNTPRPPTQTPVPRTPTTKPVVTPAVTPGPTSSVIVIISPQPTSSNPTATPTPMFEIDKEAPEKQSIFQSFMDFIASIFCRIFGC